MALVSGYTPTDYGQAKETKVVMPQPKAPTKPEPNLSERQPQQMAKMMPQTAPTQQHEQVDKSTKRFALRLTSKQRNQIKKLQKSWGLSTESAVIKKLIDDSKEEKNTSNLSHQIAELTEIKTELNRIGININQIAKKANQLNMTADELNAVMQYMNDVCNIIYGKGLKQ